MSKYQDAAKKLFNTQPDKTWRLPTIELDFQGDDFTFNDKYFRNVGDQTATIDGVQFDPAWFTIDLPQLTQTGDLSDIILTFNFSTVQYITDIMAQINGGDYLKPLTLKVKTYIVEGEPPEDSGNLDFTGIATLGFEEAETALKSIAISASKGVQLRFAPFNSSIRNKFNYYEGREDFLGLY